MTQASIGPGAAPGIGSGNGASTSAAALRADFDRSFAVAPGTGKAAAGELLAIRVGGDGYAIRLAEVASLHADPVVVPVPSPLPELRGLAGFRNTLLPVYDLRALLGYGQEGEPRWLIIVRPPDGIGAAASIALAFDHLEGHRRAEAALDDAADGRAQRQHVRGAVLIEGAMRPVIHLASVLEAITRRARALGSPEER
jgi:chemotaxis signal transduction protein